jgi:hypothetical protein
MQASHSNNDVVSKIKEAMGVLEQAACGAVGSNGATMDDLREAWSQGSLYIDDAYYNTCQHTYRILEEAMCLATTRTEASNVAHRTA